jgi:hypothetical protein
MEHKEYHPLASFTGKQAYLSFKRRKLREILFSTFFPWLEGPLDRDLVR